MNKSGLPIADVARFHKIDPDNVFVYFTMSLTSLLASCEGKGWRWAWWS